MTGEIENGDLTVRDVADLLKEQYAIIAGKYLISNSKYLRQDTPIK